MGISFETSTFVYFLASPRCGDDTRVLCDIGARVKRTIARAAATVMLLSGCTSAAPVDESSGSIPAGAVSTGNYSPMMSKAFDDPWSTEVTREEMIETSLFKLFRDLDEIRNDGCEIKPVLFRGEPLLPEHYELLETIADGMVSSYCEYLTEDIPVVAGSYDFLKEVIAEEGFASDEFGGNCGFDLQQAYASACAAFGTAWTGISLGSSRDGEAFVEERRLTIAAHELFHIVHDQINPKGAPGTGSCSRSFSCTGPVWFIEGAGEYFGRAMTQYLELQNYATFVPTDRSGYYIDGEYLSDLDFLTESRNLAGGVENYYSGQVAMELLIANKGLIPVLEVWKNMHQGMIFPVAFETSLGIELEDFYELFRTLHLRLYEEGGYCDSGLGCPAWNKSNQTTNWYADPEEEGSRPAVASSLNEDCLATNSVWWSKCSELELEIPETPENSDHGYPTAYDRIPKATSCVELDETGHGKVGWAKDFESRRSSGAMNARVSTQYYAALSHLDLNRDGVLCSEAVPD